MVAFMGAILAVFEEFTCLKGGDACGPIGILCSSSCSNQFLSILSNLIFCLAFLLNFGVKILARRVGQLPLFSSSSSPSSSSSSSSSSCLFIIITAVVNGSLAMIHIGISIWMLEEKLRGGIGFSSSTSWQVLLSHGLVLIMVTLVASMNKRLIGASFSIIWSAALILFALFFCISSVLDFVVKRELQIMLFLDSFSLIGAVLLLLIVFKSSNTLDGLNSSDSTLYEALDSESNDNIFDSDDFVTPLAKAGLFSKITFRWLNPLMKKGYQKPLDEQDIPHLTEEDRAESCYFLFMEQLNKQKQKHASPSFLWAIFCCHSNQILVSGFFAFLKVITVSSGPILLKSFIKVSQGGGTFRYEGFVLAIAMYLAKALESISQRLSVFLSKRIGLQVRSLLSAAIYQKQLCLSNLAKLAHSSGEIMNYLTVDAYRIGELSNSLHQTWSTCLQICIALLIMYDAVGLATIAAMGVIIFSVICNAPLAKLQHKFQTKLLESQDKRLKAVSEALVNMKVLKLYAWETHFQKVIESLREVEYKWLKAFQLRRGYNSFLFWSSPVLVSAATFSTCYLLSIPLNAGNVFTFVATLRIIQAPIRQIPDVIGVFIQAKVSFARITKFLHAPELQIARVRKNISADCKDPVIIKAASFSWDEHYCKSTLSDINLQLSAGEKVAICGEVGSGKSTLLAAVLGEIPNTKGLVRICGTIAYVSQNAWIQSGTIRENILFGLPMEEKKYHDTLQKCSLLKDIQMLPFGDLTEIGERGVNLSGGQKQRVQLARALYQDADIYLLDDPFSAVDAHTASSLFNEYVLCGLSTKTVLLVTHQVDFLPVLDSVVLMGDGKVLCTSHYHELLASSKEFQDLVNAHKDTVGSERLDQLVSGKRKKTSRREISSDVSIKSPKVGKRAEVDELIKKEEREIGDTRLKPYIQYLTQNKGFLYFSLAALSHGLFAGGQVLQNSWMASNVDKSEVSLSKLIAVYLAIGFGTMFFLLLRAILTVVLGIVTSRSLFAQLIKSVFRAPMSFFDSTPLGRILTRASFDLNIVDLDVPIALVFSLNATVNAYSNLGVLSFVTWQVSFVSIALVYFALWLQRYYLASARDLMRLNGTTKSMVASHLAESLAGATTIRAFGEERRFFAKNLKLINNNASPYFHNIAANEWLILRLETMSAAILSSSALVMALLPSGTFSPGFIGLALSYGLSLNLSLVASIQKQCELANCIISVERLNQYMHIPSEAPEVIESNRPSPSWPAIGTVELHELQVRYRPDAPLVLQGISCTFKGGHKIGIVGRTGSGKTTLIGALFRLVELTGGRITVDGVDISTIGLHDLRSRFGIIPQDPALFNGSVRYNLDPLGQYTDQQIWQVLDKCQLRGAVEEKEGGLDSLVVEDGSNWSMGQRQLFCLGRALLKRSRLLFLDEATASIDNATDAILQKTINTEFEGCTIIVVAHRIPTVMDSTMVLAISDGKLMEYDEPMKLIKTEGSLFGELVKEYWSQSSSSST